MRSLFVIPCKYDPAKPFVQECVKRVREHHPEADILVVDSASAEQSYTAAMMSLRATVAFTGNRHFGPGAYAYANWYWKGYDTYYLIQDSVFLNAPLPETFGTARWFADPPTPWGQNEDGSSLRAWGQHALNLMGIECPDSYRGVFGPIWWGPRKMMDDLARVGFWNCLPTTKWEACAMERVTGIVLEHLGYDVTQSLQGQHIDHFGDYDESVLKKVYGDRS